MKQRLPGPPRLVGSARSPDQGSAASHARDAAVEMVRARCESISLDLEHLTEPPDLIERDEARGEAGDGLVDVAAPLVADGQAAEAVEPSVRPFHDAFARRPPSGES